MAHARGLDLAVFKKGAWMDGFVHNPHLDRKG